MKIRNVKKSLIIVCCYSLLFFIGCLRQSEGNKSCKFHYNNAKAKVNSYYKNKNKVLLKDALVEINQSIHCSKLKIASVELKIGILGLLKEYKQAYQYVDSLKESDFPYSYKKMMNYNFFKALDYERKSDTINRNRFLNKCTFIIQKYIDRENHDSFDKDAYYDLFYIKGKSVNTQIILKEIDSAKRIYPKDAQFLDGIKNAILPSTIYSDAKSK